MTIYRGTVLDTPDDPFAGGRLRAEEDCGVLVTAGVVADRGPFERVRADHPGETVLPLRPGILLPGFVDTHVHYPQVRIIGGLGLPLLDWLDQCALPEEMRLADVAHARAVAREFTDGLLDAGTTTALVFGSHFAPAVEEMFAAAEATGLRVTTGLVTADRALPEPLLTTPERSLAEGLALAERWHGRGRLRYAVTPRFSLSATEALLEASAATLAGVEGGWFTSHVNENRAEIEEVTRLFDGESYVDTYATRGLLGERAVLAHDVHPTDAELETLARTGTSIAHCPTSNAALGSGLFPLSRHLDAGVRVALGSDVGAGTGFALLKEGLQAYFAQRLLGPEGVPLTSTHLLHLATSAGARALGLGDTVGDLGVGRAFDAVWLVPAAGDPLAVGLAHATSAEDALAKVFALGSTSDIAGVWIGGDQVAAGHWRLRGSR